MRSKLTNCDVLRVLFTLAGVALMCVGQSVAAKTQCLGIPPKSNAELKIIGEAFNADGEFLYCEYHSKVHGSAFDSTLTLNTKSSHQNSDDLWLVEYTNHQSDKLIAQKHITYKTFDIESFAPEVEQIDFRTSELRRSVYDGDNIAMSYQEDKSKALESKSIPKEPLPVIDAGFDNFVRAKWQSLVDGEPVVFDFASVPHLRVIPLRAIKKSLGDCAAHNDAFLCLHVQANNRFLRFFVGELALVYDERKQLRVFEGAVNIQDDNAKSQKAIITYSYIAN